MFEILIIGLILVGAALAIGVGGLVLGVLKVGFEILWIPLSILLIGVVLVLKIAVIAVLAALAIAFAPIALILLLVFGIPLLLLAGVIGTGWLVFA